MTFYDHLRKAQEGGAASRDAFLYELDDHGYTVTTRSRLEARRHRERYGGSEAADAAGREQIGLMNGEAAPLH